MASNVVDIYEELQAIVDGFKNGKGGHVKMDLSDITWRHNAYMEDKDETDSVITKQVIKGASVCEHFKGEINLDSFWKIGNLTYTTPVNLKIPAFYRLHPGDQSVNVNFPFTGKWCTREERAVSADPPIGAHSLQLTRKVLRANLKILTDFQGEVRINANGVWENKNINDLLEPAGLLTGNGFVLSEGTIEVETQKLE